MNIRGLTKADFDVIVSVSDRWWGGPSSDRTHPVFFYELGERGLVAEHDGEMIGFLFGFVAPGTTGSADTAYVHMVGIHPDHRRQGVAKKLYEAFAQACKQRGCQRIKSITTVGNENSVRFHEALGFSVYEDPNYAGPGRPRLVFFKEL